MNNMKAKYILPISDIHLNFYNGEFPLFEDERNKETILCIAGDLWSNNKLVTHIAGKSWLCSLAASFHSIVFVLGNHDYWGLSLEEANKQCAEGIQQIGLENVHLLDSDSINIEGTTFVGATLWTDFCQENPEIMSVAPQYMVDYGKIRKDRKANRILPRDILKEHKKQRKAIFKTTKEAEGNVVVITHHAPSSLSIHDKYKGEGDINCFYYSNLESEIAKCSNLKLCMGICTMVLIIGCLQK